MLSKKCTKCRKEQPIAEFHRRKFNGWGQFVGEDARRAVCRTCEKLRNGKRYTKKPEGEPRKLHSWGPTRYGIREKLMAEGLTSQTPGYKLRYQKEIKLLKKNVDPANLDRYGRPILGSQNAKQEPAYSN